MEHNNYTEADVQAVLAATAEFLVDLPANHDNGYQIEYTELIEWFTGGSQIESWYTDISDYLNAED